MISYARLVELLEYDAEEGAFRWAVSRGFKKRGTPAGPERIMIDGKDYKAARLAWLYVTGRWPGRSLHHLDGDKSNICWANLSNTPKRAGKPRLVPACSVRMARVTDGYRLTLVEKHKAPVDLGDYSDYETASDVQRRILECLT